MSFFFLAIFLQKIEVERYQKDKTTNKLAIMHQRLAGYYYKYNDVIKNMQSKRNEFLVWIEI